MSLPLFPTTIAGSLPKPAWLAEPEKLWAPWKFDGAALQSAKEDAGQLWLKIQEGQGFQRRAQKKGASRAEALSAQRKR